MATRRSWFLSSLLCLIALGCNDDSGVLNPTGPHIQAVEISAADLPAEFDPSRTFHVALGRVDDPVQLLTDLWNAGIHSMRAWQPLDDQCLDPLGARFTVELVADDPRILELGFERGPGRLFCATRLVEFLVDRESNPGA